MHAHRIRQIAEIGGNGNLDAFGAKEEAHRIGRIVRNREAADVDIADSEAGAGLKHFESRRRIAPGDSRRRQPRDVHGNAKFFDDGRQPGDMIAVFVSNQDGGERFRLDTDRSQAREGLPAAQPGIDQQTRPAGGDQGGIAGA